MSAEPEDTATTEPGAAAALDYPALVDRAWQAFYAEEFAEAVRLWQLVADRWPDDPAGLNGLSVSYRRLKEHDAAEAAIATALQRFPDDRQVRASYAWAAQDRADWSEAVDRWQSYHARFPDDPIGFSAQSVALRHLRRFDEADAILQTCLRDHPEHAEVWGNYAWVAQQRRDWDEALRRWTDYANRFPRQLVGYSSLGVVLRELGRYDDADAILREGLALYPDSAELMGNLGWVAYHRNDWPEALKRWEAFRSKFPELSLGHSQVSLILRAMGQFDNAAAQSAAAPPAHDASPAKLLLAFESLGDNCEFGIVQRHFGAEALGLLRFTSTPPILLTRALNERFAGVGERDNTTIFIHNGQYVTRDQRYHMSMHTFIPATGNDQEKQYDVFCRHLVFLRDKLLGDLASCEKYFLYAYHDQLSDFDIRALWDALRNYGDNRLLFVQPADQQHPSGTIRGLEDDLLVGYLDELSVDDPPYEAWLALCRKAHDLWAVPQPGNRTEPDGTNAAAPVTETQQMTKFDVEFRAGQWSVQTAAGPLPIRNGGRPLEKFGDGWQPRLLYGGLRPIYLLELENADGRVSTWFLDERLNRIAGALSELNEEMRAQLQTKLVSLHRALWEGLFAAPEPAFPAELGGFSDLNSATASALGGLIGAAAEIQWEEASQIAGRFPQVHLALTTNVQQNFLAALNNGELTWPSPLDGQPLPCHGLYIDHMISLYRCIDKRNGEVFYICASGHDLENVGVILPQEGKAYYLTERQKFLAGWACHNLRQRIMKYLLRNGHLLPEFFSRPCTRFASPLWPGESFHIGHHLWNELSGIATMVRAIPANRYPDIVVMGQPGDGEAYGKIEGLFPELSAHVRRGIENDAQLAAMACRNNVQITRLTGSYVSADLRRRILALIARDHRLDPDRAEIEALRAQGFAIIILGLRVENRTVAGLDDFCARIVEYLQSRLGRVAVALDGHNTRAAEEDGAAAHFPSFGEAKTGVPLELAEQRIADLLKTTFAGDSTVRIIDNIGCTMSQSLLWTDHAKFFISAWGAGLAKYRWVVNQRGIIWSSRWVLTQKGDLHIYDSDEFMEDPSPVQFLDPRHVFDIAEERVLIQIFEPHHPMYFNFKVNMKGLYREIDRLIDASENPVAEPLQGAVA